MDIRLRSGFCHVTNLKVAFEYSKKTCPTHLQTEKSNVSSRRNFPLGLRTGYSVKEGPRSAIEGLPVYSNRRRLRRHVPVDAKENFRAINSNQEVGK